MKSSRISILTFFLVLINISSVYAAENFYYSYSDPSTTDAQKYIIYKDNVEILNEGVVTYWKPKFGDSTKTATTPGTIIYHFEFDRTIESGFLLMYASCYHWWYSRGHAILYYSSDGKDWTQLAEAAPPAEGTASYASYNTVLPEKLLHRNNVYLKTELYSYGDKASEGGVFTNTAQHSRYQHGTSLPTFEFGVEFDNWINSFTLKTEFLSRNGQKIVIDQLVPGKPSKVRVYLKNPTDNDVQARLSIGLKVGGREIQTIGQSDVHIPAQINNLGHNTDVQTPAEADDDSSGQLLILLHDRGTADLLDTEKKTVLIYTESISVLAPILNILLSE